MSLPPGPDSEWEQGTYLGSCDWGMCDREQAGWARSSADHPPDWLAICAPCARGEFPASDAPIYPVDEFVPFPASSEGEQ